MEAEIKSWIPNIDPILSEYSVGYLTHASNAYVPDELTGPSPLEEAGNVHHCSSGFRVWRSF